MSDIAQTSRLDFRSLSGKWGWFVALGIGMILAGVFALGDTVVVTLVSVIFIGAAMLVAGVFQILHAFAIKQWGGFLFALLCGALYIAAGLIIMREPVQGSIVITAFLLAVLSVAGVLRIVMALRHREIKGWWLLLLTGIVSVGLAVLLFLGLPWSSLWLLGTVIAIELIFHGVGWVTLGFALRGMR
jgi:uncharacterized membrane protein HdeD (DUF308 family)